MSRSTIVQQCQSIGDLFETILVTNADTQVSRLAKDASDRFELWKTQSGPEHPPGSSSSLEARLRDAPYLVENISNLLERLEEALQDGKSQQLLALLATN